MRARKCSRRRRKAQASASPGWSDNHVGRESTITQRSAHPPFAKPSPRLFLPPEGETWADYAFKALL